MVNPARREGDVGGRFYGIPTSGPLTWRPCHPVHVSTVSRQPAGKVSKRRRE